jgi:hypothetical protein
VEGDGHGLFEDIVLAFTWRDKKTTKSLVRITGNLRFEPGAS